MAGVDIEAAAKPLVDGPMALQHLLHEQLLTGGAHGHEHHIGTLGHNVGEKGLPVGLGGQIAVAMAHDADARIVQPELFHRFLDDGLPSSHEVECLLLVETLNELEPEFASGHFHGLLVTHFVQEHQGTDTVTVAHVAVDDGLGEGRLAEDFLGIHRYQYAGMRLRIVGNLATGSEGINPDAVNVNFVHISHKFCWQPNGHRAAIA